MNFEFINQSGPLFLQGACMTIRLWLGAVFVSFMVGIALGIVQCRRMRVVWLSPLCDVMTFVLRGVPFYVQLLIVYFILPDLVGINLSPVIAGMLSLGLCSAAYISQIVRGGFDSIVVEQWEASEVLGFNTFQTLRYVIMPQVLKITVPMIAGECDQILKSTSVISTIGVFELTKAGMNIVATEMQVVAAYSLVAVIYLGLSTVLNTVSRLLERRFYYGTR